MYILIYVLIYSFIYLCACVIFSISQTNTFQAVLIQDGQESFVYFLYDTVAWTVGTRMGGDAVTGLGDQGNALVSARVYRKGNGKRRGGGGDLVVVGGGGGQ